MGLREEARKEAKEMWGLMLGCVLMMAYMAWDVIKVLGTIIIIASVIRGFLGG